MQNFVRWDGNNLQWKKFLNRFDTFLACHIHTLNLPARDDARLFCSYLPEPWNSSMTQHVWLDGWTYHQIRDFMDSTISRQIPVHLYEDDWDACLPKYRNPVTFTLWYNDWIKKGQLLVDGDTTRMECKISKSSPTQILQRAHRTS